MRTPLMLLTAALAFGSLASAQTQRAANSLFAQTFPQPTGRNGYEELVRAAELLERCDRFKSIEGKPATLAQKRDAVGDRPVRPVLLLVDAGLRKPITPPRVHYGFKTDRPELSALRSLTRFLVMRQYVLLADGKTSEAVRSTAAMLSFSRAIEADSMSGLVGAAMSAVILRSIGARLGQLSAADCEGLQAACLGILSRPDATESILRREQEMARALLETAGREALSNKPESLEKLIGSTEVANTDATTLRDALMADLRQDPSSFSGIISDAARQIDTHYEQQIQEVRKPTWQRDKKGFPAGRTLAGRLSESVVSGISEFPERLAVQRCQLQLLAAHCAVLRYRWENDRLPLDLGEVKLGELTTDPFTGAPFRYQVSGTHYRLDSPGNPVDPKNPRGVDGRLPISIVPDPTSNPG